MAAHLTAELRASYGIRSFPVRTGDTVKVIRGDHKGVEGKITSVKLSKYRIFVEGLTREKVDGTTINVPIHPSKVIITHLNLDDKWRKGILDQKKEGFKKARKAEKPEKPEKVEKPEEIIPTREEEVAKPEEVKEEVPKEVVAEKPVVKAKAPRKRPTAAARKKPAKKKTEEKETVEKAPARAERKEKAKPAKKTTRAPRKKPKKTTEGEE
jgi:large subunit ribosomal protein L24